MTRSLPLTIDTYVTRFYGLYEDKAWMETMNNANKTILRIYLFCNVPARPEPQVSAPLY